MYFVLYMPVGFVSGFSQRDYGMDRYLSGVVEKIRV